MHKNPTTLTERLRELEAQLPHLETLGIDVANFHRSSSLAVAQELHALLVECRHVLDDTWGQFAIMGDGGNLWAGGLSALEETQALLTKLQQAGIV